MLIRVDLFSKYMEVVRMRDQDGESLRGAVEQGWVYRHGIPDVPTDQGKYVDGRQVRDLCTECGINKNIRSTVWHYANSPSERYEGWQYDMAVRMFVEG